MVRPSPFPFFFFSFSFSSLKFRVGVVAGPFWLCLFGLACIVSIQSTTTTIDVRTASQPSGWTAAISLLDKPLGVGSDRDFGRCIV